MIEYLNFHLSSFTFRFRQRPVFTNTGINSALILMVFLILFKSPPAEAHGVEGEITKQPGYLVWAAYDDGEPMSYADVEIKAPDAQIAFQAANLDRNGKIMFYPDTPGTWQVEVKDGMGHRLALDFKVASTQAAQQSDDTPVAHQGPPAGKLQSTITGLAILFGLFGCLYGWKGRQRQRVA